MLLQLLKFFIVLYLGVMLTMTLLQRRLMYHPEKNILHPEDYGLNAVQELQLKAADGVHVQAWYIPPTNPTFPLILYFHGNAGHIGDRAVKLGQFAHAGFGVLGVSYRGFGKSEGSPSEQGIYLDATALVDYAVHQLDKKPDTLLLYGESLGSGVATQMAKDLADKATPAHGLVLEAPYTSVASRSQELYPYLPAYYLVRDRYLSIQKITSIKCPLLLFHGERDAVIPIWHGRTLLATAIGPKKGIFYPDVDHTSFDPATLTKEILIWLEENAKSTRNADIL